MDVVIGGAPTQVTANKWCKPTLEEKPEITAETPATLHIDSHRAYKGQDGKDRIDVKCRLVTAAAAVDPILARLRKQHAERVAAAAAEGAETVPAL